METDTTVAAPSVGEDDAQADTTLEDYEFADDNEGDAAPQDAVVTEPAAEPAAEPVQPTPAELMQQAEERAFQRMASWTGQRDKDLLNTIGGMIDQKFSQTKRIEQEPPNVSSILDDPEAWLDQRIREKAPRVMLEEVERATTAERNYNSSIIQVAGQMMDNDPLFKDRDFGAEVIKEIQQQFGGLNKQLHPNVNAQLLINSAVVNVYRKRAGQNTNALSGNTGVKSGVGGVKPGNVVPLKSKPVKLSPDAEKLARRWGYKEDDLARVFKD
jgi:hypothetical protein